MKVETIVSLTEEKKEALSSLRNIDCSAIESCYDCPFQNKKSHVCLAIDIQKNVNIVLANLEGGENNVNE